MIAHYLRQHKPKSRILIVDGKNGFVLQAQFQRAWRHFYPDMIEWLPVDFAGPVTAVDTAGMVLMTGGGDRFEADVINLIPPQRAGDLAFDLGLVDETGWCPVDYPSMRSRRRSGVHVVGDSVAAGTMPKAATSAVSQAAACAAAIRAELLDTSGRDQELTFTCWPFLSSEHAARITGAVQATPDGGVNQVRFEISDAEASNAADAWYDRLTTQLFG
jgi:hypothetical protein